MLLALAVSALPAAAAGAPPDAAAFTAAATDWVLSGQPLPSGEALLAFGGQPADKPDALTLLPVSPSSVWQLVWIFNL